MASPSSSVLPPRMHHCHWDWCRLTFPTNQLLIDHVIYEHVRKAQPVRRRDLPMLRRAEEGFGDSLSSGMGGILSGSGLDNMQSAFPSSSNIRLSPSTPTPSTRPAKRARIEPQSPLPPELHPKSQADQHAKSNADPLQPTPPTPPTSHAPSTPPADSHSRTNTRRFPTPSPETFSSPGRKSSAQLSSPDASPSSSGSPPATPSFNSQIARAIRGLDAVPRVGGARERVDSRVSSGFDSDSGPENSPGTTSGASQKSVERELTQGTDPDSDSDSDSDDTGANVEAEPELNVKIDAAAKIELAAQMDVDAELDGPDRTKAQRLPRDHRPQQQVISQNDSQSTSNSALSERIVLQTRTPGYRAPSPSPRERPPQRSHMQTPARSQQTSPTVPFRSGSLKVFESNRRTDFPPLSQRFVAEGDRNDGGAGAGTKSKRNEADELLSQTNSQSQEDSQLRSQDSQGSWFSGSYKQSCYQLQTQAPYESQSFSLSETSTGL